jgi:rod shape-determining protein MreC
MRNLFNFIAKNYFFFVFIALEALAFLLLIQNHQHQRSFFLHSGNVISGRFYAGVSSVGQYLSLVQVNRDLAEENARLLESSETGFMIVDDQDVDPRDVDRRDAVPPGGEPRNVDQPDMDLREEDQRQVRRYQYISARVINNSVQRRNNFMTLNKGRKHGIEQDMGVITMNGVAGIVKNVSENFSTVISLLHRDMQISVRLKKQEYIGTLVWEGGDYRRATMTYIPSHVELSKGDTIVTSGFSRMFPKDVFIGTVSDFEIRRGENFFSAGIDLATDFNKMGYVYVVTDILGDEQDGLEALNQP